MNKIGIMGGTFNPIHYGHLLLAENAYEQINLNKVLFMPVKNPPHKKKPVAVTEQQRVDMINLAISDNPHFELSTLELDREGVTYTADTLMILTKLNPDTEYYFIVGADSLFYMQEWKNPQVIFDHCTVIAANRDNSAEEEINHQIKYLETRYNAGIKLISMPTVQISSKNIREKIAGNKTVKYFLPDQVINYIQEHRLYSFYPEDTDNGF